MLFRSGEIEGTCITRAKFGSVPHEYSTIGGIEESVQEILLNLKEIVLRSNLYGVRDASICVKGPRYITAQDIILPPSIEIVDTSQPIANLTEPIDFCIELQIKRDRGIHLLGLDEGHKSMVDAKACQLFSCDDLALDTSKNFVQCML